MADTNNVIYAQQYSENIMQLAQQENSKLYNAVYQKTNVKGKTFFQDQIGEWDMVDKVGRNPNTPNADPALARRMGVMGAKHNNVMLDRSDNLKIISDPKSSYTIAAGRSIGRKIDDVIIEKFGAAALTGEDGSTSTAFLAAHQIAHGSVGLTFAKVNETQFILNEADIEAEDRYFVTSPKGIQGLMAEDKATSSDYNTLKAIASGQFAGQSWMGFQWIMSTRLLEASTNIRECYGFHKHSMCVATSEGPFVRTDERADKSYSWQIYYELNIGATRLEEARIVQVNIDES